MTQIDQIRNFLRETNRQRLIALAAVGLGMMLVLAWIATPGKASMAYLYTDLDPSAAREISEKLTQQNVPFELSADGTGIMAPQDRIAALRMSLAGDQIGGKIGYEVLDNEDPFGTSSAKSRINQTRAIEGELARSIESLDAVSRARVHLVMPERALFATEGRPASASVTLKTSRRLAAGQVDAIRTLVSAAVPELAPDKVAIVDQAGNLLARAGESGGGALDERQVELQNRLREQVEAMLEKIVGPGKVRAEIAAQLDADAVREESARYDPDLSVVAKTTTVEQSDEDNQGVTGGGPVSVSAALPDSPGSNLPGDARRSARSEISEEVSYDNSLVKTTRVRDAGRVSRLTVSVMVDGITRIGRDGTTVYSPRSEADIERFSRLVEAAIGYDESRGDSVVVENLRFAPVADPLAESTAFAGLKLGSSIVDLVRYLVLGVIALVALVVVARPLLRETPNPVFTPQPRLPDFNSPEMAELLARAASGDEDAIIQVQSLRDAQSSRRALDQQIDVAQVEGRLKASALKKVGEVVGRSPAESAAIIRQWMYN